MNNDVLCPTKPVFSTNNNSGIYKVNNGYHINNIEYFLANLALESSHTLENLQEVFKYYA